MFNEFDIKELKKIIRYYNLHNIINIRGKKSKEDIINEIIKYLYIDEEGFIRYKMREDKITMNNIEDYIYKIEKEKPTNKIKELEQKIELLQIENNNLKDELNIMKNQKKTKYLLERERLEQKRGNYYEKKRVGVKKK